MPGKMWIGVNLPTYRSSTSPRKCMYGVSQTHVQGWQKLCRDTLWKLNHFNIVRYIDAFIDNTTKYAHIIMEYCGGGTLDDVIKSAAEATRKRSSDSHKYLLTEARIWRYFAQLVAALEHCHHPNARNNPDEERKRGPLIHRDLKAANGISGLFFSSLASCSAICQCSSTTRITSKSATLASARWLILASSLVRSAGWVIFMHDLNEFSAHHSTESDVHGTWNHVKAEI